MREFLVKREESRSFDIFFVFLVEKCVEKRGKMPKKGPNSFQKSKFSILVQYAVPGVLVGLGGPTRCIGLMSS